MSLDLILCFVALTLSWVGVGALRVWAAKRGVLDVPNERSSHLVPTPRGGGAAIVGVTLGCFSLWLVWTGPPSLQSDLWYVGGGLFVAVISAWDDLRSLPSVPRLAAHMVAAGSAVWGIGAWQVVQLPGSAVLQLGWVGIGFTLFWICGMTNAYNFMDGIDGIAGLQGVVAGLAWGALGWISGRPEIALLGSLLAASCVGFLVHNRPPARIFMGDVGSAFLGYSFAILPLLLDLSSVTSILAGLCIVWVFVFDAALTLLRRLLRGEDVLTAHRSHLYQRLTAAGLSHGRVSLIYGALAVSGALAAVAVRVKESALPALLIVPLALWLPFWVRKVETRKAPHVS
jgi:Fuc2NAc and GlcNAc transferase